MLQSALHSAPMNSFRRMLSGKGSDLQRQAMLLFGIALAVALFLLDALTPVGVLIALLYVLPLIFLVRALRGTNTYPVAAALTVVIFLAMVLKSQNLYFSYGLVNRIGVAMTLWAAAYILGSWQRTEEELERSYENLEQKVRERTTDLAHANAELSMEISERRRVEAEIRERDSQLLEAQRIAKLGNWEFYRETGSLRWSEELYRIHGCPPGSPVTAEGYMSFIHPDDRRHVQEALHAALLACSPIAMEYRIVRPDGETRVVHLEGREIPLDGASHFAGIIQDITEYKTLEQELIQSRDFYFKMLDGFPNPIWHAGPDGRCSYFNRSWLTFTGRSLEMELGDGWMRAVHPGDVKRVADGYRMHFKSQAPFVMEFRLMHSDGTYHSIMNHGMPLYNMRGEYEGFVGSCFDIEARKQTEQHLRSQKRDLVRANADLEQFAYTASHDLQEPLRMVAGFVQLLDGRYRDRLDQDGQTYIQYVVEGTARMQALIRDLLAYSRVGRKERSHRSVDAGIALKHALFQLSQAIAENGAVVTSDNLPEVPVDESQLVQLFQNLIGNAVKFRGEDPPRIHVFAEQKEDEWLFAVQDNGIGIEKQHQEKIFVLFQRLHGRQEYPGTGIGLAICKKIVDRHGGRIWVESAKGRGSTFCFTFPRHHAVSERVSA